jgi:hypothetical protein
MGQEVGMADRSPGRVTARKVWLLIGAVVVFVLAFDAIERLARPDREPPEGAARNGAAEGGGRAAQLPEIVRLEGGGVEIRLDFFRRTTIRLDSEEAEDALADCLERGIAETFGEGTEDWPALRIRREMRRIRNGCTAGMIDLPPVPPPPSPGR